MTRRGRLALPLIVLISITGSLVTIPRYACAFSVLAHQAVVDAAWDGSIVPEIHRRFPRASAQEVEAARAYAYGGAHIADLGYYPFGSRLFTDLLHYVRTGDFLDNMLASARDPNEYAFALGATAHYVTDCTGHPQATNRAVPDIYPKLRQKFGRVVTYADDRGSHLMTEFRFDIYQMSRSKRTRDLYDHAMEFQVSQRVLDDAFQRTYGLRLADLFASPDIAILTYRFAFREVIQEATGIAWQLYKADIEKLDPRVTPAGFVYDLSRHDFEKQFGKTFDEPGYFAKFVAFMVKLVPNVGPFKRMAYKPLPPESVQLFNTALDHSIERYRATIAGLRRGQTAFADDNLDTGKVAHPGEYEPADEARASLAKKLASLEHDKDGRMQHASRR
ncbi:MAG TPA: zinc dependent phospholipase C family protein [Candidatus Binatia bacterium]|jgi:hypothetical protein